MFVAGFGVKGTALHEYVAMLEKGETDMQLSTFIMISEAVGLKFALSYRIMEIVKFYVKRVTLSSHPLSMHNTHYSFIHLIDFAISNFEVLSILRS